MFTYSVEEWLLLFYIYCFFGWCFESAFVSIRTRHLVNRGFMRAPFLPLYGSGAIIMLVVSRPFADNIFLTYISGCIGATLLELATGMAMEKLFKIKYWDYSNQRFNFKGHICLSSTIAWGFLTIFMTRVIHTPVEAFVLWLPEWVKDTVVLGLTVVLTWDFALSFKAALDLRDVLIKLEEAREDMEVLQEKIRNIVEHAGEQVQRAIEERGAKLETVREQIADMRENIQAGLTAGYEVRISKLHDLVEENSSLEALDGIKEEYKQWRKKFLQNNQKRMQALDFSDKFKLHHLMDNPTMSSERFKEVMDEIRKHINEARNGSNED